MHSKNIPYIIEYALFIVFFLLGTIFYRQSFLAVLLLLVCILPVISIGLTYVLLPKLTITETCNVHSITEGHDIRLSITTHNKSFFPFLNGELYFKVENLFFKNHLEHTLSLTFPARREKISMLTFPVSKPGICEFSFTVLTITDPLHLYTFTKKINRTVKISVMPQKLNINFPLFPSYSPEDEEDSLISFPGTTSHELKQIREYIPGDSLKDIHWKMTAKTDEIMVKEYDSSASRIMVLLPDMNKNRISQTVKTLYSYMEFLINQKEIFKLALYNCKTDEISETLVTGPDDMIAAFLKCYFIPVSPTDGFAKEAFLKQRGSDSDFILIHDESIERCQTR